MGGGNNLSTRSTMSTARTTPAQNPRGLASKTFLIGIRIHLYTFGVYETSKIRSGPRELRPRPPGRDSWSPGLNGAGTSHEVAPRLGSELSKRVAPPKWTSV